MSAQPECSLILDDGTTIAYRVQGQGPAFVLSNGLTTNTVFWKHLSPAWAREHTVVTWDLPGHGRSGPARTPEAASIEAQAQCVARLMDELQLPRAMQIGWSTGCQIVSELLRVHASRCTGLVMLLGPGGRVLDTARLPVNGSVIELAARHAPPALFNVAYRVLSRGTLLPFGDALGRALRLIGAQTLREDAQQVLAHIPTVDPASLRSMLLSAAGHDARPLLANTNLPVLIVAGEIDPFAPAELVGLPLHQLARRSELLRLPAGTHTALLDHAALIAEHVERFAARSQSEPAR